MNKKHLRLIKKCPVYTKKLIIPLANKSANSNSENRYILRCDKNFLPVFTVKPYF